LTVGGAHGAEVGQITSDATAELDREHPVG
jgi:hypothetical protein